MEDALKADNKKWRLILHNPGFIECIKLLDKASYMKCDEEYKMKKKYILFRAILIIRLLFG